MLPFKADKLVITVHVSSLQSEHFSIEDLILRMESVDIAAEVILISRSLEKFSYLLKNATHNEEFISLYSNIVAFEDEPLPEGVVGKIQVISDTIQSFYIEALIVENELD